jgi:quinoprotein glucose dehydrogenase
MLYRYCYCLFLLTGLCARAQERAGSWTYYGQNAGGTRYTALDKINVGNVGRLAVAWTYRTGELHKYEGNEAIEKAAFETTPILIGRTLYLTTPSDRVIAVDGATGKECWVYDPMVDLHDDHSEISNRGVAAWPAGSEKAALIFIGTIDGRLIALDAATGKPAIAFGGTGAVDLKKGFGDDVAETSPPQWWVIWSL